MTANDPRDDDNVIEALRAMGGRGEDPSGPLRARLADDAAQAQLLDIAYRIVDSPVGALLLAATPAGLVRIAFTIEGHDTVLGRLAELVSPRILHAPCRLDDVAKQLNEYFERRRQVFDLPVDLQLTHGFRRTVLVYLRTIPYGATESYGRVAAGAGNPGAVRATAGACSHNPLPIVLPCHRVVRSDGTVGGYLGGPDAKRTLLAMEAAL